MFSDLATHAALYGWTYQGFRTWDQMATYRRGSQVLELKFSPDCSAVLGAWLDGSPISQGLGMIWECMYRAC